MEVRREDNNQREDMEEGRRRKEGTRGDSKRCITSKRG